MAAFNATLLAMAVGEITPDEALTITRVFDGRLKVLKAWEMERHLTRRDPIPGDGLFYAWGQEVGEDEEVDEEEDGKGEDDDVSADTLTEPSPSGRGQGEGEGGPSPANNLHPGDSPHPDPLPRAGEGVGAPPAPLHSACIQPSPATIAGRRVAELVRQQLLRELSGASAPLAPQVALCIVRALAPCRAPSG